ncbi:MAG: NgoBV family restriction endonuclease [Muribaculaceae bacterium]|nr:NgoBV family restriction endonuclease [Muribaculaceae bacterium]
MRLTAQEIFDKLVNDDKILTKKGRITFSLGEIDIIVRQKDVVGNIMQEWMEGWFRKNDIEFAPNDNTQMPPDFYLNPQNKKLDLLEIKAFYYKRGPGFDIADFRMYEKEIAQKPWMLDVSYLIFGYDMTEDGIVTIKKVWLKKVWELSRPMKSGNNKTVWPINLQIKQGTVHKIRPAKWYGISKDFAVYSNMEDFLAAMEETVYKNKDTRDDGPDWLSTLIKNYKDFYGIDLNLPRWKDIERKYVLR